MDKDRMKGKIRDIAGRVERQAGEWTGDSEAQVKGAANQVAGKAQNAWGKTKDAAKEAANDVKTKKSPRGESGNPDDEESVDQRRSNG